MESRPCSASHRASWAGPLPPKPSSVIPVTVQKVKKMISSMQFLSKAGIKSNKGPNFSIIPRFKK